MSTLPGMSDRDTARMLDIVTWALVGAGVMSEDQRRKATELLAQKQEEWAEEQRQMIRRHQARLKEEEAQNEREHPPVEPTHPRSVRCFFGFHKQDVEVANPLPMIPDHTALVCPRCGRARLGF